MSAMEAQSASMPAALRPQEIADHFAELAAALDNDPFAIYAELAATAAAFPAEHHAAMARALAISDAAAMREAALGFAFSPDPAVSAAALMAVSQQGRRGLVSSNVVDRLVETAARHVITHASARRALGTRERRRRLADPGPKLRLVYPVISNPSGNATISKVPITPRYAPTQAAVPLAAAPMVRRLAAGGKWIRTLGSASQIADYWAIRLFRWASCCRSLTSAAVSLGGWMGVVHGGRSATKSVWPRLCLTR